MAKLSVVIPVFNEAETLRYSFDKLFEEQKRLSKETKIDEVEYIFIDDGSEDESFAILNELRTSFREQGKTDLLILRFSRNFGHSSSVLAGLNHAKGEYVAIIDADLQDPPEAMTNMLIKLIDEKWDVVYGQRKAREGESVFKIFTAWLFYRILSTLSGISIPKDAGDFRVMTREVAEAVNSLSEPSPFLRGLVAWVGFRQAPYLYDRKPRKYGITKYPFKKMLKFALHAITSFSSLPLRLSIFLGFGGLIVSFILIIYALIYKAMGTTVPGWASLFIGFTFGQSITLLVIGIIGIYMAKIHMATQNRPRYILKK